MENTRRETAGSSSENHYDPSASAPAPGEPSPSAGRPELPRLPAGRTSRDVPVRSGGAAKWVVLLVILALVVVGYLLWRRQGEHKQLVAETNALNVQNVSVASPTSGPVEDEIVLPGNLQAYTEAPIYARTSGYLKAWYTDIGAKVAAGQVMAEIEAPDVDAQLRQANAALSQAKANLDIANLNFDRQKDLLAKKVASQQEFDQNRTNVDAMHAAVQASEANVQNLTVLQNFQKIVAPFTGVVTKRNTDVGALISASNGGQELFRIARTDTLRVYVYVPQAYAAFVQIGSKAVLDLSEFTGEKFEGKVANIAGAMDAATRTLPTEIQVDNKDGRLFPGAFAKVHLSIPLKKAPMVIPVNTLIFRSEGSQVAVVDAEGTVHLKKVTIGQDFGTTLEITSGLKPEEQIIVNPSDSLADGAKVQVQTPPAKGK